VGSKSYLIHRKQMEKFLCEEFVIAIVVTDVGKELLYIFRAGAKCCMSTLPQETQVGKRV
jgi:hypothetical protein